MAQFIDRGLSTDLHDQYYDFKKKKKKDCAAFRELLHIDFGHL